MCPGCLAWVARPESAKGVGNRQTTPFADSGRATHPTHSLTGSCAGLHWSLERSENGDRHLEDSEPVPIFRSP